MNAYPTASAPVMDEPIVTLEVLADGIAVVTLDDAQAPRNVVTRRFAEELRDAFDRVARDPYVRGAVVVSAKPDGFVESTEVETIRAIRIAAQAERVASRFAQLLRQMHSREKPVVAAVHGDARGAGFEIALACHSIVASDDARTVFGLPEVRVGLIAAHNGMLRVAERAGLRVALDLSLTGRDVRAAEALELGLVDELCPRPVLLQAAIARARILAVRGRPETPRRSVRGAFVRAALEANPIGRAFVLREARAKTARRTRGHYPAEDRILDVLDCWARRGFEAAAALEATSFGEVVVSDTARRLMELSLAKSELRADPGVAGGLGTARTVERIGVVGATELGAEIAYVTLGAGFGVRLADGDDAAVGRGLRMVRDWVEARAGNERLRPDDCARAVARLSGAAVMRGFRHADVVVEAAPEDLALKRRVVAAVEAVTSETCIIVSTTSVFTIAEIASVARRPENVIGMRYFQPIRKMPLLEVVKAERTEPEVVATCVALGKAQGKTVIVVNDGPGFYAARILAPYLNEAVHLVAEGVPIDVIDRALVEWGWPIGPLRLLDQIGADVVVRADDSLDAALGSRFAAPPALKKLAMAGRKGRASGRGFYRHDARANLEGAFGERPVDPSVYGLLGVEPRTKVPMEDIQMRCSLALVNEALRCYGERAVRCARDADVGAVFGLGFPAFRGGPLRYTSTLGAAEILRRIRSCEDRFGPRFAPAPALIEMDRAGTSIY